MYGDVPSVGGREVCVSHYYSVWHRQQMSREQVLTHINSYIQTLYVCVDGWNAPTYYTDCMCVCVCVSGGMHNHFDISSWKNDKNLMSRTKWNISLRTPLD